jgi:hypothetical protein
MDEAARDGRNQEASMYWETAKTDLYGVTVASFGVVLSFSKHHPKIATKSPTLAISCSVCIHLLLTYHPKFAPSI